MKARGLGAGQGVNNRGFTLVEAILSTIILCTAVLALGGVSTRALSRSHVNSRYETAANLADKQLTIIDNMGIDTFVRRNITEGVFEEKKSSYRWEADTQWEGTDNLYIVTITVSWNEMNRWHSVTVKTMMNGKVTQRGIPGTI